MCPMLDICPLLCRVVSTYTSVANALFPTVFAILLTFSRMFYILYVSNNDYVKSHDVEYEYLLFKILFHAILPSHPIPFSYLSIYLLSC